ncbi:hypothetical protein [Rubrivirga sp.]|uniref:hypothetical protein n=1 Tax=Rubrivirga sp. TaxID=1885344 RepID=UPI003C73BA43
MSRKKKADPFAPVTRTDVKAGVRLALLSFLPQNAPTDADAETSLTLSVALPRIREQLRFEGDDKVVFQAALDRVESVRATADEARARGQAVPAEAVSFDLSAIPPKDLSFDSDEVRVLALSLYASRLAPRTPQLSLDPATNEAVEMLFPAATEIVRVEKEKAEERARRIQAQREAQERARAA